MLRSWVIPFVSVKGCSCRESVLRRCEVWARHWVWLLAEEGFLEVALSGFKGSVGGNMAFWSWLLVFLGYLHLCQGENDSSRVKRSSKLTNLDTVMPRPNLT